MSADMYCDCGRDGCIQCVSLPAPTLDALILQGKVRWDANEYQFMAHASDGVWVMVGHNRQSAEEYLSAHPNPKEW
jgi:hypothetical protein